jgi:hypothetical protein
MDYLHYQNCVTKVLGVKNFTLWQKKYVAYYWYLKKTANFFLIKEYSSNIWSRNLVSGAN